MLNRLRLRDVTLAVAALGALGPSTAHALDPRTPLVDFSLMNWPEDAGPFPFGVYTITQDRDGYLWLGTRTGLIRFDGLKFMIWRSAEPLPEDRVSVLCAARDGSLWLGFGTVGGLSRIRQGRATNFDERSGLAPGDVNAIVEGADGAIWVGTFSGLSRFKDERFQRFGPAEGLPDEQILSLHYDRRGTLWAGTSAGVYRSDAAGERFALASPLTVTDFAEDSSGGIWVVDNRTGFRPLDGWPQTSSPSTGLTDMPGRALLYDRSGSLWVGTRSGGILRVHDVSDRRHGAIERLTRREGLMSDEIRTLFEDRDGTVWIGTRMGLSRLSESSIRSATAVPDEDAYVYAITHTTDGSVWTATGSGLWREQQGVRRRFGVAQGLPGEVITALHEDRGGTLWVATTQGIARGSADRFVPVRFAPAVSFSQVRSITTDWSGALWICDSIKGLFRSESGYLKAMTEGEYDGQPYVGYTDSAGRVWIGFWSGDLAVYDGQAVRHYSAADGLPAGTVNVIYEDRRRNLWVGTSQGLVARRGDHFVRYTQQGFPHSTVVSIVEDRQGLAWFGLGSGLVRIDLAEFERADADPAAQLRYHFYGTEDGLPGTLGRPGTPSATRSADGRLWFTTSVGLAVVDPARLRERPQPGPLRIDAVTVDGRLLEPEPGLPLPPRTSRIEIDYSILNLAAAPRLRSRYRLDGFESEWQDAGEERQATYTNLPPGSYSFRVVSTTSDGSWSESGAALDFSVAPVFYQTWPFYGGVTLLALAGLWSGWQMRLRRVRRQYDLVLAERARVAREIHDTLLQSLVGVALEFDDISGQLEPSSPLKSQVTRVREQVEHYIRETRQSIWDLRSPTLASTDLVTALRDFGEAAVTSGPVRFQFATQGEPRRLTHDVEEQLLRIGQEAVTNAIRHASATRIRMELVYDADSVRLRVFDDGRGFDAGQIVQVRGSHWGVTSMRERAEHIGADFNLASHPGTGTLVEAVVSMNSRSGHRYEAREVDHPRAVR